MTMFVLFLTYCVKSTFLASVVSSQTRFDEGLSQLSYAALHKAEEM